MMILNQIQLTEIQDLLDDNFSTLIDIFLRDSEMQIEKIREWKNTSHNPTVMIAAHTLKSSAANLGLDQLASQCGLIEAACNDEKNQDLKKLINDIEHLYKSSISALNSALTTDND